jgi:hypothetical protein
MGGRLQPKKIQKMLESFVVRGFFVLSSQPVADEFIKVSAEPAWQICGIFLLR